MARLPQVTILIVRPLERFARDEPAAAASSAAQVKKQTTLQHKSSRQPLEPVALAREEVVELRRERDLDAEPLARNTRMVELKIPRAEEEPAPAELHRRGAAAVVEGVADDRATKHVGGVSAELVGAARPRRKVDERQ